MDAKSKKSVPGKLQKTPSRVSAKSLESPLDELSDSEKAAVNEMKKLYMETINLDIELQNGIYKLEMDMETKHNTIYDKRAKLLSDFRKKSLLGDTNRTGHIDNFWLKVLKASYTEFITPKDEKILTHLVDIRSKMFMEPDVKFALEFYFEPNEYFTNSVLTKTYFLNAYPNPEQPLTYDGAEIVRCEGCHIHWKRKSTKHNDNKKYLFCFSSFFDFFNPPNEPDHNDPTYLEIKALLQNDFELGFYLKERVIPKAILFFTGEIVDCQASDSDIEEGDGEDQDYEENDEDENDDTSSANSNENPTSDHKNIKF